MIQYKMKTCVHENELIMTKDTIPSNFNVIEIILSVTKSISSVYPLSTTGEKTRLINYTLKVPKASFLAMWEHRT